MKKKTTVLLEGLIFPEGPRWHDNKLWFSDMGAQQVMTVDLEGIVEKIVHVPNQPSGLGWLPDGRLLIVSMVDRKLLRLDPDGLTEVADLYNLASCHCNDMVVDNQGRAYIGNFGFELALSAPFKKAEIILVTPDGDARIVATEMAFPNGSVITPDGKTLIVGETYGSRLTAFDIEPDGSLSNRRVWAALENAVPDGICLDAESAIWVASPTSAEALRVKQGGEVTDRIKVAANNVPSEVTEEPSGRIETVRVDIPGVGLP
ncbi:MAG: SMP-30/gluconolactonase/LRE family protein [Deltaproteobacteria bacterium]|nr:SMP-30/gluconolactonase/LRE family protein [Deltaproteobacteria bacterium]